METFRHVDFPVEWGVEDISARILSRHPCDPDLLGFGLTDFYALAMIRRGGFGWGRFGSGFSSMTPDGKDEVLVDFIRRNVRSCDAMAPGSI